ncbi:MAG: sialidase family protein [Candidatus Hinthialibacter antarcticus]|nr:sialidase family protein [Candidatus Hinthialibacter antarcticus]
MNFRYVVVFMLVCSSFTFAADDVQINHLFGPELPGPYKHPASITELDNGDLYVTYYCGEGEYAVDTAVWASRLVKGESKWSEPTIIADTPWRSEGNPVVWQAPGGLVWLFYVNRYGETWSSSRIKAKVSKDDAYTWSDSFMLTMDEGTMVRGRPIVLNNGEYMLPVYIETGMDTELVGGDTASYFLRYNPKTHKWKATDYIQSANGNLQPQVEQITDDYFVCYMRRAGGYEPTTEGWMLRSESHDGGWTWTDAKKTPFKNPNAAIDFLKLQSGNLLLVFNDNMNDRTPLTLALSTDGDKTYAYQRDILTGENTFAYPYAIQTRDGKIHIVYTTDERSVVMHAVLDETAILNEKFRVKNQ